MPQKYTNRISTIVLMIFICFGITACMKEKNNEEVLSIISAEEPDDVILENDTNQQEEKVISQKTFDEPSPNDTYKNIAIFCVDSCEGRLASDTRNRGTIILSRNERTGEIKVINVQYLTYLNYDGGDIFRQSWLAYYDGPETAINMLNQNLDLEITDYITIGFDGIIELTENLGGVTVEIDSVELDAINDREYPKYMPDEIENSMEKIEETGVQTLDGVQTAAYCMGKLYGINDSYKQSIRQQEVLENIVERIMLMEETAINSLCDNLYSKYIYTSLSSSEYKQLVNEIADAGISETTIFPSQELSTSLVIGSSGTCLCPTDLNQNVTQMMFFLYNKSDYQPSQKVQEISQKLSEIVTEYQK